jgi:hypothetical protein
MLLLAIYRPTARICTEDDLLKLDFGLQMFQKMEVTASNWKYEFQPTLLISAIAVLLIAAVCGDSFKNSKKKKKRAKKTGHVVACPGHSFFLSYFFGGCFPLVQQHMIQAFCLDLTAGIALIEDRNPYFRCQGARPFADLPQF